MKNDGIQRGQGLIEYALILILVVFVVIAVVYLAGPAIGNLYSNVISNVP
jgi:pilus assembly protein Flp/PilA